MKWLVIASGFGTGLYPLTFNKSRALLDYKSKPLLTHLVAGIPPAVDVFVSTNRKLRADSHRWQESINKRIETCLGSFSAYLIETDEAYAYLSLSGGSI